MKALSLRSATMLLAVALAGCTSSGRVVQPVEATRFHLNQPIARGEVAVEPFAGAAAGPEFNVYAAAVARQLAALGWSLAPEVGASEQVALVGIEQGSLAEAPRRSPVSVGVGGGTGGYGSGVGVGVGLNLGGKRSGEIIRTTLQVRIKRRSDGTVFWEGRASDAVRAGAEEAQPAAIADRLASALFRDFPGESGHTIRVE